MLGLGKICHLIIIRMKNSEILFLVQVKSIV